MKDAESKTISPGLSQLKEFAENIGNYVLIAGNYGLRGGLGFEADGDSRFFRGAKLCADGDFGGNLPSGYLPDVDLRSKDSQNDRRRRGKAAA